MKSNVILARTTLIAAGILVGLICAELIIRVLFPSHAAVVQLNSYQEEERGKFARYDSLLGWDGKENVKDEFVWYDCRHPVRQNRHGYRGTEYDPAAKQGRRFVVLGDSYVWGFGVPDDSIFTTIMEKAASTRLEMVNTGVSGFGTDQEHLLWSRKGVQWHPDEVLLMVDVISDLWDNLSDRRYDYPKPRYIVDAKGSLVLTNVPVPHRGSAWNNPAWNVDLPTKSWVEQVTSLSAFAGLLLNAGTRSDSIRRYLEDHDLIPARRSDVWEFPIYYVALDDEMSRAWHTLFAIIRQLDLDVKKSGAKLTVVIIPTIAQVYPELWEKFRWSADPQILRNLDPHAPNRRLLSWGKQNHIAVIDLLQGLQAAGRSDPNLYYPYNLHWTEAGHGVVAELLMKELKIQ